jgi:hypothetical protein
VVDLEASVVNQAREQAAQIVEQNDDEHVYWKTVRLHRLFTDHLIESATAGSLYLITAWLTDIWELEFERREEAAALMRDAASELLAVVNDEGLDAYVARWEERLNPPREG